MRKDNQEITDQHEIMEILKSSAICRLGMTDNGSPYILPFNYGYDHDRIYIHCAPEGKKIDLLRKNPAVCFEIEQKATIVKHEKACKWATAYRSVVGNGHVEIVTDDTQKRRGLEIIMAHNGAPELVDFEPKQVDSLVILKVKIDTLTAKRSGNLTSTTDDSSYALESDRLRLKEMTWDDLERIHYLHTIPAVEAFSTIGIPASKSDTREVIRPAIEDQQHAVRKKITWTIWMKDTNECVGEAGMTLSADRFKLGEIYYNLAPEYWNRGYGTETAKRLIVFGFEKMGLHKVEAGVATDNIRSIRVLEKAGMTREGLRRKVLPIRGAWKDNYHYAIVEDDPREY